MAEGPFNNERILAIVNILVQYLMDERDLLESEEEVIDTLLTEGFDPTEIDAAFSWMANLSDRRPAGNPESLALPAHRILTAEEARALGPEAQGFLVRLRSLGIVDDETQEEIIERAMRVAEDQVSLQEIKTIAAFTVFSREHEQWRRELTCLLDDDWSRIYH